MKKKTAWIVILMVLLLTGCGKSTAEKWKEQYDLGMKYLEELDYEQAIVAFTKAIEIDPSYTEAYLKTAEAYIEIGDYESAIHWLENGLEQTESDEIWSMLEELEEFYEKDSAEVNLETDADTSDYLSENWIRADEWTVNGVPPRDALTGGEVIVDEEFDSWEGSEETRTIQSSHGITTASDFTSVLSALGITEDGTEEILKILPEMEYNVTIPPLKASEDDYTMEIWISRKETDSQGAADCKHIGVYYDFSDGMRFGAELMFYAESDLFDHGYIFVRKDN